METPPPTVEPGRCTLPPEGWWCSRDAGHKGPCAARPMSEHPLSRMVALDEEMGLYDDNEPIPPSEWMKW